MARGAVGPAGRPEAAKSSREEWWGARTPFRVELQGRRVTRRLSRGGWQVRVRIRIRVLEKDERTVWWRGTIKENDVFRP